MGAIRGLRAEEGQDLVSCKATPIRDRGAPLGHERETRNGNEMSEATRRLTDKDGPQASRPAGSPAPSWLSAFTRV